MNFVISSLIWRHFNNDKSYATADCLLNIIEQVRVRLAKLGETYLYTPLSNTIYRLVYKSKRDLKLDVLGTLRAVELEFYRRYVGPYEDLKIKENGDLKL